MPVYTMYNGLRINKIASLVVWIVDTCAVLFDLECLHNMKKNWIEYYTHFYYYVQIKVFIY